MSAILRNIIYLFHSGQQKNEKNEEIKKKDI